MIGYLYETIPSYEVLDHILSDYNMNIEYSMNVNIIIDYKQFIRKIFREPNNFEDENLDSNLLVEEISSALLNIIGHYRNYFYKQGKYTTFYILYSRNKCKDFKKINENYKKEFYEKYIFGNKHRNTFANKVTNIVEIISKYIPHCIFADTTDYDEASYINAIINASNKNEYNILLSDDICLYSLLNKNTVALNLKGSNTELVTEDNVCKIAFKDKTLKFSKNMIPVILSLSGYEKYSLNGLKNVKYKKACKIVNQLLYDSYIQDVEYLDFPIKINHIEDFLNSEAHFEEIKNNFYLITSYNKKSTFESSAIGVKLFDIPKIISISEMNKINNRYFSTFSLNLDMMWKGEKI